MVHDTEMNKIHESSSYRYHAKAGTPHNTPEASMVVIPELNSIKVVVVLELFPFQICKEQFKGKSHNSKEIYQ